MMYFNSRAEAGEMLADELEPTYRNKDCVVIALSDGAVVVGAHIAARLHSPLTLLLTSQITLPHENDAVAVIDQDGGFTYSDLFSTGMLEELASENRTYIEEEKLQKMQEMSRLLGGKGLIKGELLKQQNIILASDGLNNGFSLDAAISFLKPVDTERIIAAVTLASVPAIDRMHLLTDEFHCLSIVENFITTDHYYQKNDMPDHETMIKTIRQIDSHWE